MYNENKIFCIYVHTEPARRASSRILHKMLTRENFDIFTGVCFSYVQVDVKLSSPEFSDFTRAFSMVKVLCNRPQV